MSDSSFVRADCATCNGGDVWLRCDQCRKSDHFRFADGVVRCDCGVSYDHATCTCGAAVPAARLVGVPLDQGPLALADLEVDWRRVGLLVAVVVLGGAALAAWLS